jgi:hypothetical protein
MEGKNSDLSLGNAGVTSSAEKSKPEKIFFLSELENRCKFLEAGRDTAVVFQTSKEILN